MVTSRIVETGIIQSNHKDSSKTKRVTFLKREVMPYAKRKEKSPVYELRPAPDNPDRPRSIREQMKTAAKLAEADRGQAAPKKSAPDRGDR